jgi:hypothetical protein
MRVPATRCGPSAASIARRRGSEPHSSAQPRATRVFLHAEDRAHDHLERDPLHRRPHCVRLAERPALDLGSRHVRHRPLVAAHAPAVERGQHQLALRHVGGLVEQQHRVVAEHREQHHVCLAGVEQARVAGEDLPDRVGMGEEDPDPLVGDAQCEHVAVAAPAVLEHRAGAEDPAERLQRARRARSGWEPVDHASFFPRRPAWAATSAAKAGKSFA